MPIDGLRVVWFPPAAVHKVMVELERWSADYGRHARRHGKGSWYFTTVHGCPLCSHAETFRERRWTAKPDDPMYRYEFVEIACQDHFL